MEGNKMIVEQLTLIDDSDPELSLNTFLNDKRRIFIECGYLNEAEAAYKGFITIDKKDAVALVNKLQDFIDLME
jgi:hypothetical protein